MKKFIYSLSWLAATALTCGVTSCQNEDIVATVEEETELLNVVAVGSINNDTRTALNPTEEGFDFAWSKDDKIVILSEDGQRNIGVMTLTSGEGEDTGEFSGNLKTRKNDTKVNVYYLGKKAVEGLDEMMYDQIFNISNQETLHKNLTDYGIMHAVADIQRTETGKASIQFQVRSIMSYARFHFHLPADITPNNEVITVSGRNIMNAFTLNFADASINDKKEGEISIVPDWTAGASNEGNAYMVFVPNADAVTEFEITVNGKTYKAVLDAKEYEANGIYCGSNPMHGKDIYFTENGSWSLIYSAEGATNVPNPEAATEEYGPSYTFTVSSQVPVKEGYKFLGWANEKDGEAVYTGGDEITLTQPGVSKTIYAVWDEAWKYDHYILEYGTNGVYGRQDQYYNEFFKMPWIFDSSTIDSPLKEGYTFIGWADSENATKADYAIGSEIDITKEVTHKTVFPVWEKDGIEGNITAPGATGSDY